MSIKTIFKSLLALTTVFALASCAENDVFNPDKAQNTSSLKVPANFDWTTTRTITTGISSPVNTQVSIYFGKECKDNQLLMEIGLTKDEPREISLDLPTASNAFYVKYSTENGDKVLEVKIGANTRIADAKVALPEDAISRTESIENIDYFYTPAKNVYGTVMFEDFFPEKGDYDFNDFVVGYNISYDITGGTGGLTTDGVTLKLQIRAIGGSLPYRFGVEFTCLQTKYVRDNLDIKSNTEGIEMKLISTKDDDPAVFIIEGTNLLKDGLFYNTEKLSEKVMPEITCRILRDNKNDTKAAGQFGALAYITYNTNFFIKNVNTNEEIHLKGYATTKDATNLNTQFYTEDNFVWGMKVPVLIPNAIEKTDFTEAYPDFASWVTSGGTNNADWYTNINSDKVINP